MAKKLLIVILLLVACVPIDPEKNYYYIVWMDGVDTLSYIESRHYIKCSAYWFRSGFKCENVPNLNGWRFSTDRGTFITGKINHDILGDQE